MVNFNEADVTAQESTGVRENFGGPLPILPCQPSGTSHPFSPHGRPLPLIYTSSSVPAAERRRNSDTSGVNWGLDPLRPADERLIPYHAPLDQLKLV